MFNATQGRVYMFFGQKMTVGRAKTVLEEKKKELADSERAAIQGIDLDFFEIVRLKDKCERLHKEIKVAEKKIEERG